MIFQIRTFLWVVQFLFEVFQLIFTNDAKNATPMGNSTLVPKSIFLEKLTLRPLARVKRQLANSDFSHPRGYGYGARPYPPTYEDYMQENQRRLNSISKYHSLGYITNRQMAQMITETLSDFFSASSLGQQWGGKPLSTNITRPVQWLHKAITGYVRADWDATEPPKWRPPQWRSPEWGPGAIGK